MRYVIAVAEELSFTRAAQRCGVVQSSLSHQLQALEREIGVELFARTSRRVEITPAGRAFLVHARASLETAQRAVSDAQSASGQVSGTLAIGMIPTLTTLDLPKALGAFHQQYPKVKTTLIEDGSDALMELVRMGQLDVAFVGLDQRTAPQGVDYSTISRQDLHVVVAATHRLAGRKQLRLKDLARDPFVDFPRNSSGRIPTDQAFTASGVTRDVVFEAANIEVMLGLVSESLVITMLAPQAVPKHWQELVMIPVSDGPKRAEHVVWNSFNPSPAASAFVSSLELERFSVDG